jgi:signal peptidase II
MKRLKYLLLFLFLIGLDQGTKYLARAQFMDGDSLPIIPKVLRLIYHENDGAAWGMFSGRASLLSFITLVAAIALIYCFFKIPAESKYIPLRVIVVSIAAGAIGNNLLDRIIHGYVIDFIYFELIDFPVFNVADMYIVVGTAIFALLILFKYKEEDFDFMKKKKSAGSQVEDKQDERADQ